MEFYNTHILTVVLFTPLVGALLLLFVPRDNATRIASSAIYSVCSG
jgi:NADH:ubiquinone oxidoreductase subunit 4 (subunit M)